MFLGFGKADAHHAARHVPVGGRQTDMHQRPVRVASLPAPQTVAAAVAAAFSFDEQVGFLPDARVKPGLPQFFLERL